MELLRIACEYFFNKKKQPPAWGDCYFASLTYPMALRIMYMLELLLPVLSAQVMRIIN